MTTEQSQKDTSTGLPPGKRRWSFNHKSFECAKRKRSLSGTFKGDDKKAVSCRFYLGGSIEDPLNLNSLSSTFEARKVVQNVSPRASPKHVTEDENNVECAIPPNIKDPLNLNATDQDVSDSFKKRKRNRHRKKEDTLSHVPLNSSISVKVCSTEINSGAMSDPLPLYMNNSWINNETRSTSKTESTTHTSEAEVKTNGVEKKDNTGSKNKSQKKKPIFIHGNYNRYYGYRNLVEVEDCRLACFRKEWFSSKDVLDVGCNVGHVTMNIAKTFLPKKIVGLDIDSNLIHAARRNIRNYTTDKNDKSYPVSCNVTFGPIKPPLLGSDETQIKFPENLTFIQGNYVLSNVNQLNFVKEEYDTILALSITKWIHLNNGDDGIKIFFRRIFKHLRPGGILILEPQAWVSYKKRKNLTPNIKTNFEQIKLKPEQFRDFLMTDVGFCKCEVIDVPAHKSKGFCRPMQVYTKPDVSERRK